MEKFKWMLPWVGLHKYYTSIVMIFFSLNRYFQLITLVGQRADMCFNNENTSQFQLEQGGNILQICSIYNERSSSPNQTPLPMKYPLVVHITHQKHHKNKAE